MGIIARQSFKSGIVTYLGIIMGMMNTVILYPYLLDVEEIGILSFVTTTAALFTPFILLGFGNVVLRYFSYYQNNQEQKDYFFSFILSVVGISSLLFLALFLLFNQEIQENFSENEAISNVVILVLFVIASILPFNQIIQLYCSSYGRTAVPSLLNQLYKFVTPLLACGYYFQWYSFHTVLIGLAVFQFLLLILTIAYFRTLDTVRFKLPLLSSLRADNHINSIIKFAFFSIIGGIGYSFSNQVDMLMIADLSSTYNLGLYSWAFNIANAIATPAVLIIGIASPIIAKHLKEENLSDIGKIYRQSASTLLAICLGIFIVVCLTIDDLFGLMAKGDEFALSKTTFIMLGIAKLVEVTISLNNHIISLSKYYIYNVVFLVISSVINVGLNFILIPEYGIEGCAAATIVSVAVFSMLKIVFLKVKYDLQPFTMQLLYIVLTASVLYYILHFLVPSTNNHFLDILMLSFLFGLSYGLILYKFKLVPEINDFVNKQLLRLGINPFDK